MKYLYTLLSLLLFAPAISSAQNNYKAGYVVTLRGDTVKGFIDYNVWKITPKSIHFKKSKTDLNFEERNAANTTAFTIDGIYDYVRFIGPISQDKSSLTNFLHGTDTVSKTDTIFLRRYIHDKKISLYEYYDDIKLRFFVSENSGVPYELIYRTSIDKEGNVLRENNYYLSQLQKLKATYQPNTYKLDARIQRTEYKVRGLINMIEKLNGDSNNNASLSYGKLEFFVGAGAAVSTTSVKEYSSFGSKSPFTSPMVNLGIDYITNKNIGNFLIRGELSYYTNKGNLAIRTQPANILSRFSFDQTIISFTPQALYKFYNKHNLKFYTAIGLSFNSADYKIATISGQPLPDFRSFFINFKPKIGAVLLNTFDIHFAFVPNTRINNNPLAVTSLTSYQLGMNLLF